MGRAALLLCLLASADGGHTLRHRVRTAPEARHPALRGDETWGDLALLNPSASRGRTIFVAKDDSCFYLSIDGAPANPDSEPWRKVKVDCPAELDDPAWDQCVAGRLEGRRGGKRCKCTANSGEEWASPCPKRQ